MSKQHLGVFLKNSALAAFLVTPVCVQAQAPERCVPAVMSLSGEEEHDVAVLDVHGEWHVLSWEGVTWIALHAPDEKARCLARQLLLGGSNVRSDSADTSRTGDWGNFMRILSTDPLIRACGFLLARLAIRAHEIPCPGGCSRGFCQTDQATAAGSRSSLSRNSMASVRSSLRSKWTSYRAGTSRSRAP